jgi:dTDP-4-dehydrorhamnose reductase
MTAMRDNRPIVLTGPNGQVGHELRRALAPLAEVICLDRARLDLARPDLIPAVIRPLNPVLIVNAAAYTAVDRAESEPELAMRVNAESPAVLASEAERLGAAIISYSTDYVYDGTSRAPQREDQPCAPLNVYGRTKLAGDRALQAGATAHLILRTSWVYGARGQNFLRTMLRLGAEREELRVVDDQHGAPTWSRTIADLTAEIVTRLAARGGLDSFPAALREVAGVYHLAAEGEVTWRGFAEAIFTLSDLPRRPRVVPITTSEYPAPAPRPGYSVLDTTRLRSRFDVALPHWHDALRNVMDEVRQMASATPEPSVARSESA